MLCNDIFWINTNWIKEFRMQTNYAQIKSFNKREFAIFLYTLKPSVSKLEWVKFLDRKSDFRETVFSMYEELEKGEI